MAIGSGVGVGSGVAVGSGVGVGSGVAVASGVAVGSGVLVGGTGVAVGSGVLVGGTGVAVGSGVLVGGTGVCVAVGCAPTVACTLAATTVATSTVACTSGIGVDGWVGAGRGGSSLPQANRISGITATIESERNLIRCPPSMRKISDVSIQQPKCAVASNKCHLEICKSPVSRPFLIPARAGIQSLTAKGY